ncbi:MAG: acyl carrier protein [Lachnospiraceae bacterium]|nr:acyl carrier protein [Lachnospiraceae bacterium]
MAEQLDVKLFLEKVSSILGQILQGGNELEVPITLETSLVNGVGINDIDLSSIDYVRLLVIIEEEYDIIYDFTTVVYTVGDIYDYINNYKKKESAEKYE